MAITDSWTLTSDTVVFALSLVNLLGALYFRHTVRQLETRLRKQKEKSDARIKHHEAELKRILDGAQESLKKEVEKEFRELTKELTLHGSVCS